jgi:hypothetical protein
MAGDVLRGRPHHAAPGWLHPRSGGCPRSGGAAYWRGRIRAQSLRKLPGVMTAKSDRPLRGHEAHMRFSPGAAFVTDFHIGLLSSLGGVHVQCEFGEAWGYGPEPVGSHPVAGDQPPGPAPGRPGFLRLAEDLGAPATALRMRPSASQAGTGPWPRPRTRSRQRRSPRGPRTWEAGQRGSPGVARQPEIEASGRAQLDDRLPVLPSRRDSDAPVGPSQSALVGVPTERAAKYPKPSWWSPAAGAGWRARHGCAGRCSARAPPG